MRPYGSDASIAFATGEGRGQCALAYIASHSTGRNQPMRTIAFPVIAAILGAAPAAAQCRGTDRPIAMQLTLSAAPSTTLVTKPIRLCSRHDYRLELKAGQRIELRLTSPSKQKGMLAVFAPSGKRPADGADEWSGTLKESGEYKIEIGTDKTTTYTLRVVLR